MAIFTARLYASREAARTRIPSLTLFPIPKLGDATCCLVSPSSAWLTLVPYPLLSIPRPQFQQYVLDRNQAAAERAARDAAYIVRVEAEYAARQAARAARTAAA